MRILRLRAYYTPELTASNHMSDDMDEAYIKNGIVNVNYTPMPTRGVSDDVRKEYKKRKYEETNDGYVVVHRFPMFREKRNPLQRAFRYLCCGVAQYIYSTREKNVDVVHSGSTPPTQGALSALVAKRLSKKLNKRIPFVYNLQDIFPDSMVNAGMTQKGSLVWKIGRKMEDFTYRNADKIIVISESFKRNIMEKGVPEEKIVIVPNWVDLQKVQPVKKENNTLFDELSINKDSFNVVYAGNIGEAQGVDVILEAARKIEDNENIHFIIFGGGSQFEEIKDKLDSYRNVSLFALLPQGRVSEVYSLGDVALITCKPGTGKAGLPSKTWSIMACNTPIIASFDVESDLAEIIRTANAGCVVEPGNADELVKAINNAYNNHIEVNSRQYALANADKNICVAKYLSVLLDACGEKINE